MRRAFATIFLVAAIGLWLYSLSNLSFLREAFQRCLPSQLMPAQLARLDHAFLGLTVLLIAITLTVAIAEFKPPRKQGRPHE